MWMSKIRVASISIHCGNIHENNAWFHSDHSAVELCPKCGGGGEISRYKSIFLANPKRLSSGFCEHQLGFYSSRFWLFSIILLSIRRYFAVFLCYATSKAFRFREGP